MILTQSHSGEAYHFSDAMLLVLCEQFFGSIGLSLKKKSRLSSLERLQLSQYYCLLMDIFPRTALDLLYFLFLRVFFPNIIVGECKGKLMCVYVLIHLEAKAVSRYKSKRKITVNSCDKGNR